jgi:2-polyprenyl-6-methoxyphenol hydroxylase-like FAD-dependent oxidoreductase
VDIDGNGFSAIGRLELNQFLQTLCAGAGVDIRYETIIASLEDLRDADLLVGADGANSIVRRSLETEFVPKTEWLTNRFAWYGTGQSFDCLSLTFRSTRGAGPVSTASQMKKAASTASACLRRI